MRGVTVVIYVKNLFLAISVIGLFVSCPTTANNEEGVTLLPLNEISNTGESKTDSTGDDSAQKKEIQPEQTAIPANSRSSDKPVPVQQISETQQADSSANTQGETQTVGEPQPEQTNVPANSQSSDKPVPVQQTSADSPAMSQVGSQIVVKTQPASAQSKDQAGAISGHGMDGQNVNGPQIKRSKEILLKTEEQRKLSPPQKKATQNIDKTQELVKPEEKISIQSINEKKSSPSLEGRSKAGVDAEGNVYPINEIPAGKWVMIFAQDELKELKPHKTGSEEEESQQDHSDKSKAQIVIDVEGNRIDLLDQNEKTVEIFPSTTEDGKILTNNGQTIAVVTNEGDLIETVSNDIINKLSAQDNPIGSDEALINQHTQNPTPQGNKHNGYIKVGKVGSVIQPLQKVDPNLDLYVAIPAELN